jgi:hypothetical protein
LARKGFRSCRSFIWDNHDHMEFMRRMYENINGIPLVQYA